MSRLALGFGAFLTLLGIGFYLGTGRVSPTALIPAVLGVVLALAGLVARREALRRHAMHAAVLVGLLGFLGSLPGLLRLPALVFGVPLLRPLAVVEQAITAFTCLVFIALGVRSFVAARRTRSSRG